MFENKLLDKTTSSVLDKNQLAMPRLVTLQLNGFFCLFFLAVTVVFFRFEWTLTVTFCLAF